MEELLNVHARVGSGAAQSQHPAAAGGIPELAGADLKSLKQQANTLWKFLDELAVSDPAEYSCFIEKQASAASSEAARTMNVPVRDPQPLLVLELPIESATQQQPSGSATGTSSSKLAGIAQSQNLAVVHVWAARDGA